MNCVNQFNYLVVFYEAVFIIFVLIGYGQLSKENVEGRKTKVKAVLGDIESLDMIPKHVFTVKSLIGKKD